MYEQCELEKNHIQEVSGIIDNIINKILAAMEKRQGDVLVLFTIDFQHGEAVDLATSALNRILKNVMDSPKQKLFVNVLNNLPFRTATAEAESVYKTLFDMYENKGEMFNQFVQPVCILQIV